MSTNQIDLILSKRKKDKTFNKTDMEMKKYYLIIIKIFMLDIKKLNLNKMHYFSEEKFSLFLLPTMERKEYEKHIEER